MNINSKENHCISLLAYYPLKPLGWQKKVWSDKFWSHLQNGLEILVPLYRDVVFISRVPKTLKLNFPKDKKSTCYSFGRMSLQFQQYGRTAHDASPNYFQCCWTVGTMLLHLDLMKACLQSMCSLQNKKHGLLLRGTKSWLQSTNSWSGEFPEVPPFGLPMYRISSYTDRISHSWPDFLRSAFLVVPLCHLNSRVFCPISWSTPELAGTPKLAVSTKHVASRGWENQGQNRLCKREPTHWMCTMILVGRGTKTQERQVKRLKTLL